MKKLNSDLYNRIQTEWQPEYRKHADDPMFIYIGRCRFFDLYITIPEKYLRQSIRAFLRMNPEAVILVVSEETPEYIDVYMQSVLDESPVSAHDIHWESSVDFWDAGRSDSMAEFSFELDKKYGKRRLERRFVADFKAQYRNLAAAWTGLTNDTEAIRQELSLTSLLRLLFIAFISSRYILDNRITFVQEEAARASLNQRSVYRDFLQPLFFETLNRPVSQRSERALALGNIPFLNGGLFMPTLLESENPDLSAPNACWIRIIDILLDKYTYSSEFDDPESDKLDPMMLGHIFESLMSDQKRHITGSFYTPMPYAKRIARDTIYRWLEENYLSEAQIKALRETGNVCALDMETAKRVEQALSKVTILDPTAGSGAFLQSAHQCLFKLRTALKEYLKMPCHPGTLAKEILVQNLYGVDIIPEANHLCELRLWLEIIQHYRIGEQIPTLPNLDVNIRCGDSLVDISQFRRVLAIPLPQSEQRQKCERLKQLYRVSSGFEKKHLAGEIDREIRQMSDQILNAIDEEHRRNISSGQIVSKPLFDCISDCTAAHLDSVSESAAAQLKRMHLWRTHQGIGPGFSYDIHFGDIIEKGGFDIVIGNPPWFSLHRMPLESRRLLQSLYKTARGMRGAKAQSMDISAVFVEKSLQCVRPKGIVSMLVPNKLFYAPSYVRFRNYANEHAELLEIKDLSGQKDMFDASTYPASLILKKPFGASRRAPIKWPSDPTDKCPSTFRNIRCRMGDRFVIKRGICTGANHIYIGEVIEQKPDVSIVQFGTGETAEIENELLHPVIRGSALKAYDYVKTETIVFTHEFRNPEKPVKLLPPHALMWFDGHAQVLGNRSNVRRNHAYGLCGCSSHLKSPKVVWRDISEKLEACFVQDPECIPINTIYYIPVDDENTGYLLAAYLNSSMVRDWCYARAAHAQNGYRRYFAWVIEDLPYLMHAPDEPQKQILAQIVELSKQCHLLDCGERENLQLQIDRCFELYLAQYGSVQLDPPGKQRMLEIG